MKVTKSNAKDKDMIKKDELKELRQKTRESQDDNRTAKRREVNDNRSNKKNTK